MTFSPFAYSVKQLLTNYKTFTIPFFQRDYSWEKIYYSKFLDDIISMIENTNNELTTTDYFIGTMLLVSRDDDKERVEVIDGQQRLTVITILFSVLSDVFIEINEKVLSKAIFKYVRFQDDNGEYQDRIYSPTSTPYFEKFIQVREKLNSNFPSSEEETNLKLTYDYFLKHLSNLDELQKISTFKNMSHKDILISIRDQLLKTTVIVIDTTDRDKSNMIFEILNAKAKSLASIDLIKNVIFEVFYNDENNRDKEAQAIWTKIQSNIHDRNDTTTLANFYRQYWISKYKKDTNTKLYDSFKKIIKTKRDKEENKKTYMAFLKDLEKESITYNRIVKPLIGDYKGRQEYKWLVQSLKSVSTTFGNFQCRIVLLALMDIKSREYISSKKFKETIIYLENFIFSYSVIGKLRSNFYEPSFSKFAINVRKSRSKVETIDIIDETLINKLERNYIRYADFEMAFIQLTYKKTKLANNANSITKYVVNKIGSSFNKMDHDLEDSSIEHILPEASSNITNIGNLIVLEEYLNNRADDLDFNEKICIYKESKYKQMEYFIEEYKSFDLNEIIKRAKNLAHYYYYTVLKRSEKK